MREIGEEDLRKENYTFSGEIDLKKLGRKTSSSQTLEENRGFFFNHILSLLPILVSFAIGFPSSLVIGDEQMSCSMRWNY